MRQRTRTVLRWSAGSVAAALLFLAVPISALALPYPLFGYKMQQGSCVVYSDAEFDEDFGEVLADVNRRLESVAVSPPAKINRVFLCRSQSLYATFARLSLVNPSAQGFNLSIFGNTFVSLPRVRRALAASWAVPRYSAREGDIAHVIAHEIVHDLSQDAVGYLKYRRLPMWKREGYAEYGAIITVVREDPEAGLEYRVSVLFDDSAWPTGSGPARVYYRAELLVEYLIEVEGYGFEDIMDDGMTFERAYSGLTRWYGRSKGVG